MQAAIDWDLRYARMRMHTALHLLSAVLPYPVTGGAVGDREGRLDFDIPERASTRMRSPPSLPRWSRPVPRYARDGLRTRSLRENPEPDQDHVGKATDGYGSRATDRDHRL